MSEVKKQNPLFRPVDLKAMVAINAKVPKRLRAH